MNIPVEQYINRPLRFKYTFHIEHQKYDYYQIKGELTKLLLGRININHEYSEIDVNNYIYIVINNRFNSRFVFQGDTNAYLTEYSETKGSLIISFVVLITGAITNYGSIRDSIDYFEKDLERLFSFSLQSRYNGFKIESNIQDLNDQNIFTQKQIKKSEKNQYNLLASKVKINRIFLGFVFFISLLSLILAGYNSSDSLKQNNIDDIILKNKIEDVLRSQKIDYFLKTKIDSMYLTQKVK